MTRSTSTSPGICSTCSTIAVSSASARESCLMGMILLTGHSIRSQDRVQYSAMASPRVYGRTGEGRREITGDYRAIGRAPAQIARYNTYPLLSLDNVTMRFGDRRLFEDVTCTFLAGRRYAITGPNGAGKSTLMKILTREIEPSHGSVTRPKKVGILRQDQFSFDKFRVIDT